MANTEREELRKALDIAVRLYSDLNQILFSQIPSVYVDELGYNVDLTKKPTSEEIADLAEHSMRLLGREILKNEDEELLKYEEHDLIDQFFKEQNIQCGEDLYQRDLDYEVISGLLEKLLELRMHLGGGGSE